MCIRDSQKEVHKLAKTSEKYEVMYVLNPNLSEEETAALVEKFKALVEQNGTLDEMEEMGKRKLAYEINYLTAVSYTHLDVYKRQGWDWNKSQQRGLHLHLHRLCLLYTSKLTIRSS